MKLRSYLAVLVLAGLIPLVALTAIVTVSLARQQRAAVEQGLSDTVAALTTAIENDLQISIKSLETLATSKRLDQGDLSAFYDQAVRVRALHQWSTIGLIDSAGEHRLNVARPLGDPLPDLRDRPYFTQVMATGKPYVSDLLKGRATATEDIGVAVPVIRDGRVKYVLFAGVDPSDFNTVFQSQRLPEQAVVSIVSRDGLFISRSPDHPRFVGRSPEAAYLARVRAVADGAFHGPDLEGVERDTAYKRMHLTGWTVGFGVPAEVLRAPVRRVVWTGVLVGAGIVIAAVGLAVVFARRMATSIETLAASAAAVGRGEPLEPASRLPIAELDEMGRSLANASVLLQERQHERAELLAKEQAARAEAEAASRAKDQFLAMLGHELRNPLGAIAGAVGVLNAMRRPEPAEDSARSVIERQVQHLSHLVDDLLDVSRVTSGKVVLDPRPLELGRLVLNMMSNYRASGRLDQHQVSVQVAPLWVDGDETRIEQIVSNIVSNALKYTPAGGRVSIALEAESDKAALRVTDTGVGIPPQLVDKVFDLFVQGDRALDRAQGGLGLGLTLVKRLVELHGGTVDVASEPARGSTFTVRLPRIEVPSAMSASGGRSPVSGRLRRVLVVEDNDDARAMLCTLLALAGHEVDEAADGPEAIARALSSKPEVAIIDIGLPGVDGYEVARRLRTSEAGRAIVLVALTGYGRPEDKQRAQQAGFDAHLVKPVTTEALERILIDVGTALR